MRLSVFDRVEDIPADRWDDAAPADFFFSRSFLGMMAGSRVEDAAYRFLIFHDDRGTAALAVLSAFTLKLDLLSGDRWTALARSVAPRVLDVPIICCGIPASYGQHHLHLTRPGMEREMTAGVDRFMEAWAAEEGCDLLFWKEWNPAQPPYRAVSERGYHALPTLPDHRMPLPYPDIASFLGSLRSHYRRLYRSAAGLLSGPGPVWSHGDLVLKRTPFEKDDVPDFHAGYSSVLERSRVRLETYPPEFFRRIPASGIDSFLLRLSNTATHESLAALMYGSGRVLTFGLISKQKAWYGASLYRTLLQCMVLHAIKHGYAELRLGQTSGYAKCSVGARPWRLETFVRARRDWKHRALGWVGPHLFPEVESPDLSVFRAPLAAAAA